MMEIKYSKRYYDVVNGIPKSISIKEQTYLLSIYESIFTKNLVVSYYKSKSNGSIDYSKQVIFLEYDSSYTIDSIILDVELNLNKIS